MFIVSPVALYLSENEVASRRVLNRFDREILRRDVALNPLAQTAC